LPYDIDEILTAPYFEYDDVVKSIPVEGCFFIFFKELVLVFLKASRWITLNRLALLHHFSFMFHR